MGQHSMNVFNAIFFASRLATKRIQLEGSEFEGEDETRHNFGYDHATLSGKSGRFSNFNWIATFDSTFDFQITAFDAQGVLVNLP